MAKQQHKKKQETTNKDNLQNQLSENLIDAVIEKKPTLGPQDKPMVAKLMTDVLNDVIEQEKYTPHHHDKLSHLSSLTGSSITIEINPQRDLCKSASSLLTGDPKYSMSNAEVRSEMSRRDTIIYIKTSDGTIMHYDTDRAMELAIKLLSK